MAPFENGNRVAVKHSFYATKFQPLEREEIAKTAELLRELLPLYSTAFEPSIQLLAARLWRVKRAYAFIEEHAEEDVPRSLPVNLGTVENAVSRDFEALGLIRAAGLRLSLCKPQAPGRAGHSSGPTATASSRSYGRSSGDAPNCQPRERAGYPDRTKPQTERSDRRLADLASEWRRVGGSRGGR